MKKLLSLLLATVLALSCLAGCGQSAPASSAPASSAAPSSEAASGETAKGPTAEKPLVLKLGHVFSVDTPMDKAAKMAAQKVEERTNGAIKIEVSASGALPSGADGIEQCIRGANYISLYDISAMADWVPDYVALCGPFLVDTREEFRQLCESDLVAEMNKKAEEQGVKVLAIPFNFGFRNIGTRKMKVDSIDDLKGINFRVPGVQLYIETFNALGCNSITTPSSEVYNAIQTGLADGHETSLSDMAKMQMQEVLKYITMTKHFIGLSSAVMSNEVFNSLSEEQQNILVEEFKNAAEWCSAEYEKGDAEALEMFKAAGVEIVEIDTTAFKEATKAIYSQDVFPTLSPDIYERLQAELTKIRAGK